MRNVYCFGLAFFIFLKESHCQGDTTLLTRDIVFESAPIQHSHSDLPIYVYKKSVDIPVLIVGLGWSGYALTKIYNKNRSTPQEIEKLNSQDVSPFNRWAINEYSKNAGNTSDLFFYGSMPLPLILLLDDKIRKDAGKVGGLFMEAMGITGLIYTASVYFVDKYRPYAYNPSVPMDFRLRGGAKNSFFAGHVALVGTSTFFIARVFADYHPNSKIKWLLYSAAGLATGATAYLRYKGGFHFPSDILIGTVLGPLAGILVPYFHKSKLISEGRMTLMPSIGGNLGFTMIYRL